MSRVSLKGPVEPVTTDQVDNRLELIKYTSDVQSRIKTEISSDFILAKLGEQDKEAVIEMTSNAYFCKKIGSIIKNSAKEIGKWEWNGHKYIKVPYAKDYLKKLDTLAGSTFDAFMTRIYMTVLLNRNVPRNYILKMLAGERSEEDGEEPETKSIKERIKGVVKNEEKDE